MTDYRSQIHDYLQSHRQELVEHWKELVRIPSVKSAPLPGAPFGPNSAQVLRCAQRIYQNYGFDTQLDADGGYLLSFYGSGEKTIGMFAHADVVPPGEDWIYTTPFDPIEKDGFLIGRGVSDNKSAVMLSLYCARLLRDLNIPFHSRLVMFTGSNEENGMEDIRSFTEKHGVPDVSLVCDSGFPVFRGDKGIIRYYVKADRAFDSVLQFEGGSAFNVILGKAQLVLHYNEALFAELTEKAEEAITVTAENDTILLHATGISRHAAAPDGSRNAGWMLVELLSRCDTLPPHDRALFTIAEQMLRLYNGSYFGIENIDTDFGPLTCANGIIRLEDGKLVLSFDIRHGPQAPTDWILDRIRSTLAPIGWELDVDSVSTPFVIPADNPFILAALDAYKAFTGDENADSHLNAGGTYAKYLPGNALETGICMPRERPFELPSGHGGAHQPDECISIDGLLEAIELTLTYLLACDQKLYE